MRPRLGTSLRFTTLWECVRNRHDKSTLGQKSGLDPRSQRSGLSANPRTTNRVPIVTLPMGTGVTCRACMELANRLLTLTKYEAQYSQREAVVEAIEGMFAG